MWLTEQFPLKTEELLPLLDILANKVKAVRRMRELLTTKIPPGTFPVKVRRAPQMVLVCVGSRLFFLCFFYSCPIYRKRNPRQQQKQHFL